MPLRSRRAGLRAPARVACLAAVLPLLSGAPLAAQNPARDPYRAAREKMVDHDLAAEGIDNPAVLNAMRTVPRHLFVRADLRPLAYFDQALDIGFKQTISPPFIVAYMTQVLDPQPDDRVLEIGTGSGYQAAVLSPLVKEVFTIEIVPQLGRNAERILRQLKCDNVQARVGDGYAGWPEHAPFNKIIVTCSPEAVPQPLIDQLAEGGRLIVPLGERYQQVFHLFEKQEGRLTETQLLPTLFVPMTGQSEAERDVRPDPQNPRLVNGGFEQLLDDGLAVGWHYQRRIRIEQSGAPEGSHYLQFENTDPGRMAHILQGFAVDGTAVSALTLSLNIRVNGVRRGTERGEEPSLILHYFDQRRHPIGQVVIGPWLADSESWQDVAERVLVPIAAREAILQIGLNGSTGSLSIDNVRMTPDRR